MIGLLQSFVVVLISLLLITASHLLIDVQREREATGSLIRFLGIRLRLQTASGAYSAILLFRYVSN